MRTSVKVGLVGLVMILLAVAQGVCEPLKSAQRGTFVGISGAYTNLTGDKIQVTAVILSGTLDTSTNSVITVTQNSQTFLLAAGGSSNTLSYISGSGGFNLERDGVINFGSSCTAVATNWFRIEGR